MTTQLYNDNQEAGIRAIYTIALKRLGPEWENMRRDYSTEFLLRCVIEWEAPLREVIEDWEMGAAGNDKLEAPTRMMLHKMAREAWARAELEKMGRIA